MIEVNLYAQASLLLLTITATVTSIMLALKVARMERICIKALTLAKQYSLSDSKRTLQIKREIKAEVQSEMGCE